MVNIHKMAQVKAVVVWGEKELPVGCDPRVHLWEEFVGIGAKSGLADSHIHSKMSK